MSKIFRLLLVCLFNVVLLFVPSSLSCRCYQEHEHVAFCRGDYALKFRVVERSIVYKINGQYLESYSGNGYAEQFNRFTISGLQTYQTKPGPGADMTYIYARASGAACGRSLETDTTYATIGGYIQDYRFFIDSCMSVINLDSLGYFNRTIAIMNLQYLYKKGCENCRVSDCRYNTKYCLTPKTSNMCEVKDLGDYRDPFQTSCFQLASKTCTWFANGLFKTPAMKKKFVIG